MANSGLGRAGLPETGTPRRSASRQGSKTARGRKRSHRERADLDGENVVVALVDTVSPPPYATIPTVMSAGNAGLAELRDGSPSGERRRAETGVSTRSATTRPRAPGTRATVLQPIEPRETHDDFGQCERPRTPTSLRVPTSCTPSTTTGTHRS